MYPKDCCKNTTVGCNYIPTHYNHIIQSYHDIMTSRYARGHEFDNIAYNIIPFVSMQLHRLLFFLQLSPATSIKMYNIFYQ